MISQLPYQLHLSQHAEHCLIRRVILKVNLLVLRLARKVLFRRGFAKLEHGEQRERFLSFGKAQRLFAMRSVQALDESHFG
jgi:hypothetical protein